ncbi:DUF4167 domain-containing protein [Sphingomonas endolithica]|uniref:DUF4167 domain-containing protein n=1 Tax=Sphingomonas endolithica TaxID=2972485 RepID=UPI0021B0752A|nr:DUF4167 domain-containing protein [Sphingomonas sp. ZFBP2030]
MINNRQAGRRRGRGGQQQRPQGNSGRQDTGNRIDNRSRGNAAQLLEKYKALARDSQMSGDRVNTEYYLQFADHYFRVLAETRSRFEENRTPAPGGANTFQDDEQDYDDEGEPVARAEQPRQNEGTRQDNRQDGNRQDGGRQEGGRQEGNRQDGNRSDGPRQDSNRRDGNRQDGRQNGQNAGQEYQGERQSEGNRGNQNDRQDRQDRPSNERAERPQYDEDRPRRQNNAPQNAANGTSNAGDQAPDRYVREDRGSRGNRAPERAVDDDSQDAAPSAAVEPVAELPLVVDTPLPQEAPRRRGRPRREPVADTQPDDAPAPIEADRLPPSLNISAVTPVKDVAPANDVAGDVPPDGAEEKPRRRRGRPPASEVTPA